MSLRVELQRAHVERLQRIASRAVHDDGIDLKRKPKMAVLQTTPEPTAGPIPPPRDWLLVGSEEFDLHPFSKICRAVCRHFNVTMLDIKSRRRRQNIVRPRQICSYLGRKMTGQSLPEIGRRLGNIDHTTVLHAVRKIESLIGTDPAITEAVVAITNALHAEPTCLIP